MDGEECREDEERDNVEEERYGAGDVQPVVAVDCQDGLIIVVCGFAGHGLAGV